MTGDFARGCSNAEVRVGAEEEEIIRGRSTDEGR